METVKIIKIDGRNFTVRYPNVGQFIDIEAFKQALTRNRYGAMAAGGTVSANTALDVVDAVAFFMAVSPEVVKRLSPDESALTALSPMEAKEMVAVYRKELAPWMSQIMTDLNEIADAGAEDEADGAGK